MAEIDKIRLNIEGMTCAHCALGITKNLESNGAENVDVNFATGEANFGVQHEDTVEIIIKGINRIGYKVLESSTYTDHPKIEASKPRVEK